jgi:exodeoxyribonuclease-3
MKIISWNVNGIRSVIRKGFWDWLHSSRPQLLCLQETRIQPDQLTEGMRAPSGYHTDWSAAQRRGYSGVATFCQEPPQAVRNSFGHAQFDAEGRVLITRHDGFTLFNIYFPNGRRSRERVEYKIAFYDALLAYCVDHRTRGEQLIVCGDFNTAHQPIDLARPKQNEKTSGFLPEERRAMDRWLDRGFVDIYRHLHPEAEEYTWWTYRYNARARNIGWRIDYFFLTADLIPRVRDARILGSVPGSDHCPIELELEP